jgi:sulfite exporter TauE/SafE
MNMESLIAAFLVGLLGGTHCIGMCGGIVGALTAGLSADVRNSRLRLFITQLTYNTGRVASYVAAGVIAGVLRSA